MDSGPGGRRRRTPERLAQLDAMAGDDVMQVARAMLDSPAAWHCRNVLPSAQPVYAAAAPPGPQTNPQEPVAVCVVVAVTPHVDGSVAVAAHCRTRIVPPCRETRTRYAVPGVHDAAVDPRSV